ncbi:MAG: HD domain-containing protein [Clostridia bacterium]|nr:HD domain-containing protein [Clostridia bacterium]
MIALGEDPSIVNAVWVGSLLHDIGRGRHLHKESHGEAGYRFLMENVDWLYEILSPFGFDIETVEKILLAVRDHDKGLVTNDKIIGSIWDSDRLSLYRFKGREVKTELLSTETAKLLKDYAKQYIAETAVEKGDKDLWKEQGLMM